MPEAITHTSATATSDEPVSTTSIIESAIADLPDRGDDSGSDEGGSTSTGQSTTGSTGMTGTATSTSTQTQNQPTQAEVDELAAALGIKEQGTGKWTTRVAYSKLHKVIKERDAKTKADHESALKQHVDQLTAVQQQIAAFDQMVSSPERLLTALAQVNPAYAQYVQRASQASTTTEEVPTFNTAADLQRYVQSQIDRHVSDRLAPIEQERQQRQVMETAIPKVNAQIAEAEKWPLFTESKAEILAELQKNPNAGLRDAYQTVVIPKLAADHDKIRQEVLAELNGRPHSTSVTSTVSSRTAETSGPQDTQAIIRQAIRGLK